MDSGCSRKGVIRDAHKPVVGHKRAEEHGLPSEAAL
jgi:hypothetical protein